MKYLKLIVDYLRETSIIPIILVAVLLYVLVSVVDRTKCSDDVTTTEYGEYKIVEIETHGEKHEYLYFHKMYGRSLCHLPNCRYCRSAE